MSDELLEYYNKELVFFRKQGADFARNNPAVARQLGVSATGVSDPHVERLIEAFAYLNARIRHKLDDDFPELAQALLQVVYPHYLAPVPSMAVLQLIMDAAQAEPAYIERHTLLETETMQEDGNRCRFRTCYPVSLLPLRSSKAELSRLPFRTPEKDCLTGGKIDELLGSKPKSILKLSLETTSAEGDLSQWSVDSLRFFINAQEYAGQLYELILNDTIAIAIANAAKPNEAVLLPPQCLAPVGFEPDETMLPGTARSFPGYFFLTEFFAFPQKFLFFDLFFDTTRHPQRDLTAKLRRDVLKDRRADLGQISRGVRSHLGKHTDIYFYLNREARDLQTVVSADTFELGCTPVVNLFSGVTADSQRLSQTQTEYHVVVDHRCRNSMEIYSIDRVMAKDPHGNEIQYEPFYSFTHAGPAQDQRAFWHAVRRPSSLSADGIDHGTEIDISLVDLAFSPSNLPEWTLEVETTCLNRDIPDPDPQRFGQPNLRCFSENAIQSIRWLEGPTKTKRRPLDKSVLWKLISHANLNHLSLTALDGTNGGAAGALREVLTLYDYVDDEATRSMIDGIVSVVTARDVGRTRQGLSGGLCRGTRVTVQFDEEKLVGRSAYLLASVLERFLALYCSINSFSRLVAKSNKGTLREWGPRAGDKPLL